MPAKARWLTQIPEMIEKLSCLDLPVIDRAICERVFEVGRRQAIYLLKIFGGYECGNSFLIDRLNLIGQLKCMAEGEEIDRELRRKRKLADELRKLERYRSAAAVQIAVKPETFSRKFPDMPEGVVLSGGQLIVQYTAAEQLLERLYGIAQAAANDLESFRSTVDAAVPTPPAAESNATLVP